MIPFPATLVAMLWHNSHHQERAAPLVNSNILRRLPFFSFFFVNCPRSASKDTKVTLTRGDVYPIKSFRSILPRHGECPEWKRRGEKYRNGETAPSRNRNRLHWALLHHVPGDRTCCQTGCDVSSEKDVWRTIAAVPFFTFILYSRKLTPVSLSLLACGNGIRGKKASLFDENASKPDVCISVVIYYSSQRRPTTGRCRHTRNKLKGLNGLV